MQVRKAVITAAGRGARQFPAATPVQKAMLPVVDRDGLSKPVIQIIAEEALDSGIESICIVCTPGDEEAYAAQFRSLRDNLVAVYGASAWARQQAERIDELLRVCEFVVQEEPQGYGHAVYCAKEFAGNSPFLLMLSDHLYVSDQPGTRCAQQLLELAGREASAVAALHPSRESVIRRYGTVGAKRVPHLTKVYQIDRIIEKPDVTTAERELHTPGLRAGHYLCFFGMHVLTPSVFSILDEMIENSADSNDIQLTPALQELALREKYLGLEVAGRRYDIGARYGLFQAQLALGMAGGDREQLLAALVDGLAEARVTQTSASSAPRGQGADA